jgi:prolyl oligopeptidase
VQEQVEVLHGVEVADPYRWLEDLDSAETRAWVDAQNGLTERWLDAVPARDEIRARLRELWSYERYGMPTHRAGRYFVLHNDGLQPHSVLYWMQGLDGERRKLIDPSELSEDATIALAGYYIPRDGKRVAYALSEAGSDWRVVRIRDVESGRDLEDELRWIKFSGITWTEDGTGFYYSRYPAQAEDAELGARLSNQQLYFHRVGTRQSEDRLIYEQPDHPDHGFAAALTEGERYLLVSVWKGDAPGNGVLIRDLHVPDAPLVPLIEGFEHSYAFSGISDTALYFRTDRDGPRGRLIAIDAANPGRQTEVIPEGDRTLLRVFVKTGKLVAQYLQDARSTVELFSLDGAPLGEIALPGVGTARGFGGIPDESQTFFSFTSFTRPTEIWRHDLATGEQQLWRAPEVEFDPNAYLVEHVFVESKDGTRIPLFVVRGKDARLDGNLPVYLSGYGGFGRAVLPGFSVTSLAWLERGGAIAQASLRGGGEYGREWHEAGTKLKKQNVFDDFIAVAEWLIDRGYTRPERLAIGGGSNGGLLVGAVMTQRPELFGAAMPMVGVLDMLRFHRFTIGWAWTKDYGSPDDPEEFRALLAYSPYHNLAPETRYPTTLVTTADHDDRVHPSHSFKFAARLQAAQAATLADRPTLIRVETRAGHGFGMPTDKRIALAADRWTFLVRALGMPGG